MATSSFYNTSGSTPTQATDIATSVDQAQDAAQEAEAKLNEFKSLYMGIYSTPPTASQDGSLYFNDASNLLYYWNGTAWTATNTTVASTDDIAEGSTNQYFTAERVDDQVNTLLTAGSNVTLTYDDAAGTLTIASTGGGGGSSLTDTDDLTEGTTNLYYTDARADARIAAAYTDSISEGSTNLYYTGERVDDQVNNLLTAGANITLTYDDVANTLTIASTASGGSTTFTGLTDTPSSMGTSGQYLAVNSGGTALEFVAAPSGGGGTGDTTYIRYSSSTGQQAPLNISNVHTAGTNANAYTGQAATKDGSSGQGITVAYTGQGGETRGNTLTFDPTYKVTLTNNTGSNISLSKTGTTSSMEVKLTSSSVSSGNTTVGVYLEPPTATSNPPQTALQLFSAYAQITSANSGIQHTLSDTAPTNNWTWANGEDLVIYIGLFTNSGTVSAADITLDELTFMYAGAASTYNSSTTTTQGIRLNFAYTRSYSTLNTTPAATDSLIGFYDGATASTDGNDYDWTVFVEEPNSALAADDMLIYSTSNGWTYGKPSLYALSNVNTSSAPSDGQVLTWDNANSYWTPASASGGGSGIALTDLSVTQNSASGNGSLAYNNTTGVFTFTPAEEKQTSFTASSSAANINIFNLGAHSGYEGGELVIVADRGTQKQVSKMIFTHLNGAPVFTTYAQMVTGGNSTFAQFSVVQNSTDLNLKVVQSTGGTVTYNAVATLF